MQQLLMRRSRSFFVSTLLLCVWIFKITQMFNYKEEIGNSMPRSEEGWKFNTSFPVDLVYTWVNGSDPKHQGILTRLRQTLLRTNSLTATRNRNIANNRFADNGGLRYSLRSVEKYANWIRHVFIVTNDQIPNWLNLENPRVTIVKHEEIFDHPENLPTLASPALEHNIYKIRGLSEKFIYMNDDWMFGRNVTIADFYTEYNSTLVYLAWPAATQCSEECTIDMIKNDVCDDVCNYDHCVWDGGDCVDIPEQMRPKDTDISHSTYDNSIFYTNAVFNKAFGIRKRWVIAHAPLFIEKKVNEDMVKRFMNEVNFTVQQKVRSPFNMQFECTYMYFLMEGTNKRFEPITDSPLVSYVMITVDETQARKDLNMLLKNERKFICLNDHIDYKRPDSAEKVIALMQEFYNSMFPKPSSFEIDN